MSNIKSKLFKLRTIFKIPYNFFLVKRFPFLKVNEGYDSTWLDYMGPGWKKAFGIKMCKEIKTALKKGTHDDLHTYQIAQVKEKYGTLRWYDDGCYPDIFDEVQDIISKYENISETTCFKCGKPATKISRGWICPWCDKCVEKAQSTHPGMKFDDIEETGNGLY